MNTRSFFGEHTPSVEVLDYEHSETIPDQCLTVREILTQFTRSGRELPDIETGDDDDIDGYDDTYDDIVDAFDARESSVDNLRQSVAFSEHVEKSSDEDNNVTDDTLK